MRIGGTTSVSGAAGGFVRSGDRVAPATAAPSTGRDTPREETGRALVALRPRIVEESPRERLVRHRAHAPFLAQLAGEHEATMTGRLVRPPRPQVIAAYERALDRPGLAVPGWLVDAAL
jgi:hypothetical protein